MTFDEILQSPMSDSEAKKEMEALLHELRGLIESHYRMLPADGVSPKTMIHQKAAISRQYRHLLNITPNISARKSKKQQVKELAKQVDDLAVKLDSAKKKGWSVDEIVDERPIQRTGVDWFEMKKKVAKYFEKGPVLGFNSADEFAAYATHEDYKKLSK